MITTRASSSLSRCGRQSWSLMGFFDLLSYVSSSI
jgi:hypothetical protein